MRFWLILLFVVLWLHALCDDRAAMRTDYFAHTLSDVRMPVDERLRSADSLLRLLPAQTHPAILKQKGDIAFADERYTIAIDAYRKLNAVRYTPQAAARVANMLCGQGWFNEAISTATEMLQKGNADPYSEIDVLQTLARSYIFLFWGEKANDYLERAEKQIQKSKLPQDRLRTLRLRQWRLHFSLAMQKGDINDAFKSLKNVQKDVTTPDDSILYLTNQAMLYDHMGDTTIAHVLYEKIRHAPSKGYAYAGGMTNYLHFALRKLNQPLLALELGEEMQPVTKKLGSLYMSTIVQNQLAAAHAALGQWEEAYEHITRSSAEDDRMFNLKRMMVLFAGGHANEQQYWRSQSESNQSRIGVMGAWLWIVSGLCVALAVACAVFALRLRRWGQTLAKHRSIVEDKNLVIAEYMRRLTDEERALEQVREIANTAQDSKVKIAKVLETLQARSGHCVTVDGVELNFSQVHERLVRNLRTRHPDVTDAEMMVAIHTVAETPVKEIAAMRNLSVRTVQNTKYRLTKRLGVAGGDLHAYLMKFL